MIARRVQKQNIKPVAQRMSIQGHVCDRCILFQQYIGNKNVLLFCLQLQQGNLVLPAVICCHSPEKPRNHKS